MTTASTPLVTVIIPTYNYSSVLRYAIMSVLNQTLTDFELIVVGDGCTDDSAEVVASFCEPRIRWHNLPVNTGGQGAPNNKALEIAQGKYVAYLGHDDLWLPNHLELLTARMEEDAADWGHSIIFRVGPPEFPYRTVGGYLREKLGGVIPAILIHRRQLTPAIRWTPKPELPPHQTSEVDFVTQLVNAPLKGIMVDWPTALKFTSSHRKNSYLLQHANEQRDYLHRIQHEPDFLRDELYAVAKAYATDQNYEPDILNIGESSEPGHLVEQLRRIKGLAPQGTVEQKSQPVLQAGALLVQQRLQTLERVVQEATPERERLLAEMQNIQAQLDATQTEITAMRSTRAWKMAEAFWRLRDRVLRRNR